MATITHETDVLIIGGSAGGMYAAINAQEMGAKVFLISKALLGRGGCSATFGYIGGTHSKEKQAPQVIDLTDNRSFHDKIKYYGHYLADQEFAEKAWSYNETFYHRMEEMGLYIRRTDDGDVVTSGGFGYGPLSAKLGTSGKGIMDIFRSQIFQRKIPYLEEATGVTLIRSGERVTGAIVFDYMKGTLHEIHAKSVILACGHVNWLWDRNTATREQAGNGLAMAFRAGAELAGIEQVWWHIADVAHPKAWMRSHMYPNPIPMTSEVVEFYNSDHEMFFHGNMFRGAQPSYYLQCKALTQQIKAGKARRDGGYYASFGKIDPYNIREYATVGRYMEKLGLDPKTDMIECAMTSHQQRGGVVIDHGMATRVEGLFISGSLAADFITGIITVAWEAETAARSAVNYARKVSLFKNGNVVREVEAKFSDLLEMTPRNPIAPSAVKEQLRQLMGREMNYFKSGETIERAIEGLREIRNTMLPRMQIKSKNPVSNYELLDAIDISDMLDVAELISIASRNRTESRGAFYRSDYPFVDNKNWLKNIHLSGNVSDPTIKLKDVNLKYVRPADEKADFLTTDY